MRITYVGAAFLAVIAIIPNDHLAASWRSPYQVASFYGGTGPADRHQRGPRPGAEDQQPPGHAELPAADRRVDRAGDCPAQARGPSSAGFSVPARPCCRRGRVRTIRGIRANGPERRAGFPRPEDGVMRLVLVGPPGSGKGTQAELLVKRLGLTYVGTGDILRDAIRAAPRSGKQVEPLIKQGLLVPDPIVNDVVAELFRGAAPARAVRDGRLPADATPRRSRSTPCCGSSSCALDAVVNLAIPDDEVVRRISGRRCCSNPACGAVLQRLSPGRRRSPGKCDKCGSAADAARRRQGGDGPPPARRVPQEHRRPDRALPRARACCARSRRRTRSRRSTRTSSRRVEQPA